jgi:flagellar basal-body rod protein FlgB
MNNLSIGKKLYDQTIGLLNRSLDIRTSRHKILSSNIANAETSDFTPKDLRFQKILEQYTDPFSNIQLQRTHPHHFPAPGEDSTPLAADLESGPVGEAVNIDQEMAKLAENNVMFQAGIQVLIKKFEALKFTISEVK